MKFSKYFKVNEEEINNYGAVDISLFSDTPLFIDPMLIFSSNKEEYKTLHQEIIEFFSFVHQEKKSGKTAKDIEHYFDFSEIKQTWLGYSKNGNCGNGLGKKFKEFLSEKIEFIFSENEISKNHHFEKVLLLYDGTGKDKISDLTTRLILDFLAIYTETFAKKFINEKQLDKFAIETSFNYEIKVRQRKEYILPYFIKENGKREYVLLVPKDILRTGEPAISKDNMYENWSSICDSIPNEALRARVNEYIRSGVRRYEENCRKNGKNSSQKKINELLTEGFKNALVEFPKLYDYFINMIENNSDRIKEISKEEVEQKLASLYLNHDQIAQLIEESSLTKPTNSLTELVQRIKYFKHKIEKEDVYKVFYNKGKLLIEDETTLQLMFRLAWYGTPFDVNYEGNNGGGEYDTKVSMGANDKCISEFKLAKNPKLYNVFSQVRQYEEANNCPPDSSIIVIFAFNEKETNKFYRFLKETNTEDLLDKRIFLIDCREDNKISASKLKK